VSCHLLLQVDLQRVDVLLRFYHQMGELSGTAKPWCPSSIRLIHASRRALRVFMVDLTKNELGAQRPFNTTK
jgi:hypothetical protein